MAERRPTLILVAHCDDADRAGLGRVLREAGHSVIEASTASDAHSIAEQHSPDLLVLDLDVEDVDGLDLVARLKAAHATAGMSIILTSATFTAGRHKAMGLESGADACLVMPVDAVELLATVRMVLRVREVERELRESELRYRQAMRAITGLVWEWETKSNRVFRSDGLYGLLGVRPEDAEPTQRWWNERCHPDDLARLQTTKNQLLGDAGQYSCDYRVRHADGRWIDVWERGVIERDSQGRVVRLIGFTTDVTERRRAERALDESERRFRGMYHAAPLGMALVAADGTLLSVNQAFCELVGYRADELVGRTTERYSQPEAAEPPDADAPVGDESNGYAREKRYIRKDGTPRWVRVTTRPYRDPATGAPVLLKVVENITDRHLAEQRLAVHVRRQALLLETSAALVAEGTDEAAIVGVVHRHAGAELDADVCIAYRLDDSGTTLELVGATGLSQEMRQSAARLRLGEAFCGTAAASGAPVMADHAQIRADERGSLARKLELTAYACHPLLARDGRLLGTLSLACRRRPSFEPEDMEFMQALSRYAALAWERTIAERAGRRTEDRYRSLVEATSQIVWTVDSGGRAVEDSPTWRAFTGQTLEQWLGYGRHDAIHPDDIAPMQRLWDAAVSARSGVSTDYRLRRADGSYRWTTARIVPVLDEDGRIREWVGTNTDIHERVEAERALRASEERLRLATEAARMFSWDYDVRNRKIVWSENAAAILGCTPEELRPHGDDAVFFVDPAEREQVIARFRETLAQRLPQFSLEFHGPPVDGRRRFWRSEGRVLYDDQGPVRALGVNQDLTARLEAQERLAAQTQRLDSLLTAAPLGVAFFDREHRYVEINRELALIDGIPAADHLGLRIEELLPQYAGAVVPLLDRVFATGESVGNVEISGETPAAPGSLRSWLTGFFPVGPAGRPVELVGIWVTEITERKRAERGLLESEDRLRIALEASGMGWWQFTPSTGIVRNDAVYGRIHGITGREWHVGEAPPLVHPDDLPHVRRAFDVAFDPADPKPLVTQYRIRRADGAERWLEAYGRAAFDGEGAERRAVEIVGTVSDITDRKLAEDALRRGEERLRFIADRARVGYWDCDVESGRIEWSPMTYRLYGIPESEPISHERILEAIHRDDRRRVDRAQSDCREGRRPDFDVQFRVTPEADAPRWLYVRGITECRDGRPERMAGIVVDVTERVAAEALAQRQSLLVDLSLEPIFVWDLELGIVQWNAGAERLYGYRAEEAVGRSSQALLKTRHPLPIARFLRELRARGEWTGEVEHTAQDGRTVIVESRQQLVEIDGRTMVLETDRDVTERKRAVAALAAREAELRMLSDNSPDLMTRFDSNYRHVYMSAAAGAATGRAASDFLGKTSREAGMPSDLCDAWESALERVFRTGTAETVQFAYRGPSGERHFASKLVPEFGADGAVQTVLGVSRDVTDRVLRERELEDNDRRKNDFLAMLAHELRNPLAAIRSAVAVLDVDRDDPGACDWGRDVIARQSTLLTRLIDDLLDVSRITRGKIQLKPEPLDLREVLQRAADGVRAFIEEKRHTFEVRLPDTPLPVRGDPARLEQIAVNLLNNAAKYTDPGGHISLSAGREGDEAVFRVRDTGVGIAREQLPHIFGLFTQVEGSLDRAQGGLGIGLTLVRRLAEKHGGRATAASAGPGRGSEFTVSLPIRKSPTGLDMPTPPEPMPAPPVRIEVDSAERPAASYHVLIVDDNADAARGLARMLSSFGYRVVTAIDGRSALLEARRSRPRVVLLDIGMPGMDGYAVARAFRSDPALSMTALIAISGYGQERDRARGREAGFDDHFVKPVDIDALLGLLRRLDSAAAAPKG